MLRMFVVASALIIGFAPLAQADFNPRGAEERAAMSKQLGATEAPSACSLCYTCGGNWPVLSGVPFTEGGAVERGSRCYGSLRVTNDNEPRLCCRRVN